MGHGYNKFNFSLNAFRAMISHRHFRELKREFLGKLSKKPRFSFEKIKVLSSFENFFVLGHESKISQHDLGQTATLHGMFYFREEKKIFGLFIQKFLNFDFLASV